MHWLAFFSPILSLTSTFSTPVEQASLNPVDESLITTPPSTLLNAAPTPPRWRYILTANIGIDTHTYNIGGQSNSVITGGNWTNADGDLIASVVDSLGSQTATQDANKFLNFVTKYTVRFIDDSSKVAFVEVQGLGAGKGPYQTFTSISTDFANYNNLNRQKFYGTARVDSSGTFVTPLFAPQIFA